MDVINHYKLASMCFVGRPRCGDVEPMMYWLNDSGGAPTGSMPDEDCIPFDRDHIQVVQVGDHWKIVEGTHWLMDFGPGQGNAVAALHFIRMYRFDSMCFLGRPGPSMTYFKTNGRRPQIVVQIDPRRLDVTLDEPSWRRGLAEAADELAPAIDLTDQCLGDGPATRSFGRIEIEVKAQETSSITHVHGVTGLSTASETEIRLGAKAAVVDVGLAHFGGDVSVTAYAGAKKTGEGSVDPTTRHFQNIRLVALSIDRVVITSDGNDEAPILGYVRFQPKRRVPGRGRE